MNTQRLASSSLPVLMASIAATFWAPVSIHAADVEKADNTTALNLAASYISGGPPGASDRLVVTSTMATARTANLGADLSISGILVDATATKTLQINGANILTLGSQGISIASTLTGAGLTFNGPAISLSAAQTWDFGTKGVTFSGTTTIADNGFALNIAAASGQIFFKNTTPLVLNAAISGGAALTLDAATDLTLTNSASSFTGGLAISASNTVTTATMSTLAGSGTSAVGSGGIQLKGGTLKYTGNTATSAQNVTLDSRFISKVEVTTAGQTLTLSSLKNTNISNPTLATNGANLGGAGNLTVTNVIADSTQALKTAFSINKFGTGRLTLNAVNTYTGATVIEAGTLALGSAGSISTTSAITVAAGATFDTSARTSYSFSTAATTTIGVNAISAGQIKTAAVTFTNASLNLDFGTTTSLLGSYALLSVTGAETGDFSGITATGTSISGSFSNAGSGNWTLTSGGYNLTFSESLGTLTAVSAVPEPSTYAAIFGVIALAGAALRRRKSKKAV